VKAVLHYLDQVNVLNVEEIEKFLTDYFVQSTGPQSLGIPSGVKEEDRAFLREFADKRYKLPLRLSTISSCQPTGAGLSGQIIMYGMYGIIGRQGRLGPCA